MNTSQAYPKMALNYQLQLHQLSPGYRFQPSDQELIRYYLKRHVEGFPPDVIPVANVYDVAPFDLDGATTVDGELKGLYFLTKTRKRYPGGTRVNREAGNGNWRVINKETTVKDSQRNRIGSKRYLVYRCRNPSSSEKNWHMNEYRLSSQQSSGGEEWVLCKITKGKLTSNSVRDTNEMKDIDEAEEIIPTTNGDNRLNEIESLLFSEEEPWDNNLSLQTDQYPSMLDFFQDIPMNSGCSYQTAPADTTGYIDGYGNGSVSYWPSTLLSPPPTDQYQPMSDFSPEIPMNVECSNQTAPADTTGYAGGYGNGNGFCWTSSTLPLPPPSSGPSVDWYHEASSQPESLHWYQQPDKDSYY